MAGGWSWRGRGPKGAVVVGLSGGPTRWGGRFPASGVLLAVLTGLVSGAIYGSEATTRTDRAQNPATGPRALRTGGPSLWEQCREVAVVAAIFPYPGIT